MKIITIQHKDGSASFTTGFLVLKNKETPEDVKIVQSVTTNEKNLEKAIQKMVKKNKDKMRKPKVDK